MRIAGLQLAGLAHLAVEARWQEDPLRAAAGSAGWKDEQWKNWSKMPEADG